MLTMISLLLVLIASLIGLENPSIPNYLLDAGVLLLAGHILSRLMVAGNLPPVLGYLFAGVIAGPNGVGLIAGTFAARMDLVNAIFAMVLTAHIVREAFSPKSGPYLLRTIFSGALGAAGAFALTMGFFAPFDLPLPTKLLMALIAATASPVITAEILIGKPERVVLARFAFGAIAFAVVFWGVITAWAGQSANPSIRFALMPTVLGAVSLLAGIAWGYLAEMAFYRPTWRLRVLYPLVVMFLVYPLGTVLGLDIMFLAVGIGCYNGLFSEREPTPLETSQFPALLVFAMFGMHLSLQALVVLGAENWNIALTLAVVVVFTRTVAARLALRLVPGNRIAVPPLFALSLGGPLAYTLFRRFIPAYADSLPVATTDAVIGTSMLLIAACTLAGMLISRRVMSPKPDTAPAAEFTRVINSSNKHFS